MIVIKYPRIARQTARRIAEYIKNEGFDDVRSEHCSKYSEAKLCVNWGCNYIHGNYEVVLNPPERVGLNSTKVATLKTLREAGYPVGDFVCYDDEFSIRGNTIRIGDRKIQTPLIFRPPKHRKGKHFIVVLDARELPELFKQFNGGYARKYYNKLDEYRVHVVGYGDDYRAIGIMWKAPDNPTRYTIRNHAYGWRFTTLRREQRTEQINEIMRTVKLAVKEIGLNVASVDLATYRGGWFILEINSASGVSSNIIAPRYARRIISLYNNIFGG